MKELTVYNKRRDVKDVFNEMILQHIKDERDAAIQERDEAIEERDMAISERNVANLTLRNNIKNMMRHNFSFHEIELYLGCSTEDIIEFIMSEENCHSTVKTRRAISKMLQDSVRVSKIQSYLDVSEEEIMEVAENEGLEDKLAFMNELEELLFADM